MKALQAGNHLETSEWIIWRLYKTTGLDVLLQVLLRVHQRRNDGDESTIVETWRSMEHKDEQIFVSAGIKTWNDTRAQKIHRIRGSLRVRTEAKKTLIFDLGHHNHLSLTLHRVPYLCIIMTACCKEGLACLQRDKEVRRSIRYHCVARSGSPQQTIPTPR